MSEYLWDAVKLITAALAALILWVMRRMDARIATLETTAITEKKCAICKAEAMKAVEALADLASERFNSLHEQLVTVKATQTEVVGSVGGLKAGQRDIQSTLDRQNDLIIEALKP